MIQREGDNVDMFCEARATPTPSLTWLKDGREMTSSDHVTVAGRKIQMKGLGPLDAGLYTCRFTNAVGTISHHIKLVIQGQYVVITQRRRLLFQFYRMMK
jgi:Immunoglobulin I-set domain